MENFIGKDNFVWWYGVVEDNNDPLKTGRCKVRIFGWHSENLNEMPTSNLPWTITTTSPNAASGYGVPRNGEYVMGFFQDGMSGQSPVMLSVVNGLTPTGVDKSKGFSPQGDLIPAQPPSGQVGSEPGKPARPRLSRGIVEGTGVAKTNADIVHVCDITGPLRYSIALTSLKIGEAIQAIRKALAALWAGTSSSPFADEVRAVIKAIKAKLKLIQRFIKKVVEKLKVIQDVIKQLQQLIAYIQSLPARLAALLKQCLTEAMASLKDAIANSKEIVASQESGAIAEAAASTSDISTTLSVKEAAAANTA